MNIFYLHESSSIAAELHCDKHVVKMILEYAQLLSTAHRVLDGTMYYEKTANGRKIKRWKLDDVREQYLYKATHVNHPSTIWTRSTREQYLYVYNLFYCLCKEYTHRYGKKHKCEYLLDILAHEPTALRNVLGFVPAPQAMPDDVKDNDTVTAYRNYYVKYKQHFAKWTNRHTPEWFKEGVSK